MSMRSFFVIIFSLLSMATASADERSQAVLRGVAEYVRTLGSYDATFTVVAGDYQTMGHYSVAGDNYHIVVGQAEVYADGKVRYEVDHDLEEVNIDEMDVTSRNILDNPTRCFDFVGDEYSSMISTEIGNDLTLVMRANDTTLEGDIYLTVDKQTSRPRKIVYVLYDDRIEVTITTLVRRKTEVEKYNASKYRDYEIIDFR